MYVYVMDAALAFLEAHGYWLLFGLGFAEFAGVPIASAPVLLAAARISLTIRSTRTG